VAPFAWEELLTEAMSEAVLDELPLAERLPITAAAT
jgi:hypothetical protein